LVAVPDVDNHPLVRRLESIADLGEPDRQAIVAVPLQIAQLRPDQDVVREGDRPLRSCLVLSGVTCMYKMTGDGKRQILSFQFAGDIPDLQSLHLKVLDNSLGTITPCRVGFVEHEALRDLCERFPRIASALWRATLIDAAIFREWMTNIGRRQAYARMAHLLCEIVVRLHAVGLAEEHGCDLPMTQNELGDATGMSTVHVNRTLQELRGDGLITLKGTALTIQDWDALKEAGDFDSSYLHIRDPEPA